MTQYTNKTAYTLAATVLLLVVLLALSVHGRRNRIVAPGQADHAIGSPEEAYALWKGSGVRGRTLVLFDRYPHIRGRAGYDGTPRLSSSNLVEFCVFENIVRKVYLVVPDDAWPEFLRDGRMRPLRAVRGLERGLFLFNLIGIALIATTPSSLPHLEEAPLVYINAQVYDEREARDLLARKRITSDSVVTVQGTRP